MQLLYRLKKILIVIIPYVIFIVRKLIGHKYKLSKKCSIIIFSKNRVPQLDLLITSIVKYVKGYSEIMVLFHASDEQTSNQYKRLTYKYLNRKIKFFNENVLGFRRQLKHCVRQSKNSSICFLVDDDMFYRQVNLAIFSSVDAFAYQPSLRLGKNISKSWIMKLDNMPLPNGFKESKVGRNLYEWEYRKGIGDWMYTFSLDGNIFHRDMMSIFISFSAFKNPNSLEKALQKFRFFNPWLRGLSLNKSVLFNNPANKVQTENDNENYGDDLDKIGNIYLKNGTIRLEGYDKRKIDSVHTYFKII